METVICPFCGVQLSMCELDKNAGRCVECDTLVPGSIFFDDSQDDFDDVFDDLDVDDPLEDDLDAEDDLFDEDDFFDEDDY